MNTEFLKSMMWKAHYTLKQGTTSSFYHSDFADCVRQSETKEKIEENLKSGKTMLLPIRLSFIDNNGTAKVNHSGRGKIPSVKQLKANFTRIEVSPYKQHHPFKVCTSIWQEEGYKCYYYGTIGITPAKGLPPIDNGDLIVFYTPDWKDVDIYIFKGMNKPNNMATHDEIVKFIDTKINIR